MPNKTAYFLFNKDFEQPLESYLRKNPAAKKKLTIITANQLLCKTAVDKYSVKCISVNDYFSPEKLEHFNREAIRWLHRWSQTKFTDKESLTTYFKTGSTSLWWISGYLYLYSDVMAIISNIEIIANILKNENFDSVIIPNVMQRSSISAQLSLNDNNFPYKVLKSVCKELNIKFDFIPVSFSSKKNWHVIYIKNLMHTFIFRNIYLFVIEKYRKIIVRFNVSRRNLAQDKEFHKQKILFLSPSQNWGRLFDLNTASKIHGDTKIGYLYQKLNERKNLRLIGIDCNSMPTGEFKILKKKLIADRYLRWRAVEAWIDQNVLQEAYSLKRDFSQKAKQLLNSKAFQDSFVYKNINFYEPLRARLKFALGTLLPHGAKYALYYEHALKNLQPDLIIATYETGLHGRAATLAAFETDVPVVAIQHGKIHRSHPQYIHNGVNPRNGANPHLAPVADMTCVFGEYTKDVLVRESGYPEEQISITGQIATDAIQLADKLYNRDAFSSLYNLDSSQKTICLLSQYFDNPGDLDRFFRVTCQGMNHFPNCNFLIKMHPRQSVKMAVDFLRKYHQQPGTVRILKAVDLYEVIFNSDIIITGNSTVGIEAMIFKKPLITIEGFKYSMEYAERGASIGIRTSDEMTAAIKSIMDDAEIRNSLLDKSQRYLKYHLYKVDGNVCQRIIDECDKLIGES